MPFDPQTATIGGMALISIHLTIMAQVRSFLPKRLGGVFDVLNYPLGFVEVLLVNPPWPLVQYSEWRDYVGAALAVSALASISAKKVIAGNKSE